MGWSTVRTKTQRDQFLEETFAKVKELQRVAQQEGLLVTLELGSSFRPNTLDSYYVLYLNPEGTLSCNKTVRDSIMEEWVRDGSSEVDDEGLRELIPRCGVTPQKVQELIDRLKPPEKKAS